MIKNRLKIIFLIGAMLISAASITQASDAPLLISPRNNSQNIKTQKLILSWFKVTDENMFNIQYALDSLFTQSSIEGNIVRFGTEAIISDLTPETKYYWRVKVDSDTSNWSTIWNFTTTGPAVKPQLSDPADGEINQQINLTFKWLDDPVNAEFDLHISSVPDFTDTIKFVTVDDTLAEVSNLGPGTVYYWRVKGYNVDARPGEWSDHFQFKTVLEEPGHLFPQDFKNNIDTSLTFRWTEIESASNYLFELSASNNFDDTELAASINTTTTEYLFDSLKSDSIYFWRISAVNSFGDSSNWSIPTTFKTKLSPPTLVSPADSSNNIDADALLQWSSFSHADYFRIQIAEDINFSDIVISEFSDSTSLSAELENYNWYFWRINARNNSGDTSHWSDPYLFKTKLSEPVLVSPSNNSSTVTDRYAFRWESVKGAHDYNFQLANNPEFSSLLYEITISDSIYIIDSLDLNSTFYWRVRGMNNAGDISNWPSPYIFTTTNVISSTSLIAKELNFSYEPSDTVGIVTFNNVGDDEITYNFIEALPDSIFSTDKNSLTLSPNSFGSLTVLADTSEIDTGYYYGTLNLISQLSVGRNDTTKIPIVLNSLKAIGSISVDTLIYDTTLAKSSNTKEITIRNKGGNFQLDLIDFKFSGPNSESFKITEAPEFIPPNDSAKILIEFDPEMQDSNSAELAIETNTYPKEIFNINLSGIGKGASFSESTIASLQSISDSTFESLTSNDKEIIFINNGTVQLKFDVRFTENYFRVSNTSNTNIRVEPGDSVIISLQYLTPNFDTLNIDTLKIYHNAFGENPMDIVINGTYDSLQSSNEIISKLYINGSLFTGEDYLVEERTSITASVNSESLLEQPNLNFKLNYFQGGPGEKLSATKNGPDKYIIPFQHLTNRGLIFKGELFTKGMSAPEIDSITIFEFVDVEVVFDNYSTGKINVPRSSPASSQELADSKWAFFGFPFEEVIADSLFAAFGGISNMEDGEWIVYEYDESNPGSFTQFSGYSFNPNRGYFVAQALRNDFDITYNYQHQLKSRKLTDTEILLDGTGWKTISSPYTFDVEIDTPAVLHKYDTNNKRYRLTSIMRPGEAYFVEPDISELKMKTYGQYFPDLYPKIFANLDWHLIVKFEGKNETDEIIVSQKNDETREINYLKAPKLSKGFEAFIKLDDNPNKYAVSFSNSNVNTIWNISLINNQTDDEVSVNSKIIGAIPDYFDYLIIDQNNRTIANGQTISLIKGIQQKLKIIVGTKDFINETIENLQTEIPTEFHLSQNYPNPFNPTTKIKYTILDNVISTAGRNLGDSSPNYVGIRNDNVNVTLVVYDILGREITTLVNREQPAGSYEVEFDASKLSSGIYYYRISAGSFIQTKKMVLLK